MSNPYSWYARYPRDYGEKTAHLSLAEHGAYTLLLDHYMTSGGAMPIAMPIAMHAASLCYRICRAQSDEERAAVDSVVVQFFTIESDGCLHNKRADIELGKRKNLSETRASVAKKGAAKRWGNSEPMPIAMPIATAIAMPEAMLQGIANGCTSTFTATIKEINPPLIPPLGETTPKGRQKLLKEERAAKRCRLPDLWAPLCPEHHYLADELGVGLFEEMEKFKDHHVSRGNLMAGEDGWNRAFNNWLRQAANYKAQRSARR